MALAQDISPLNPELMDTLVSAEAGWLPTGENAWIKVLWTGSESGQWAALFRWNKGYVAEAHKHLSAAHTYVLKGKLEVRDGYVSAGDYLYEHGARRHRVSLHLRRPRTLLRRQRPHPLHRLGRNGTHAPCHQSGDGLLKFQVCKFEKLAILKLEESVPALGFVASRE